MTAPKLPWDTGYTPPPADKNLIEEITGMATDAITAATKVGGSVIPTVLPGSLPPVPAPTAAPPPVPPTPGAPPVTPAGGIAAAGSWVTSIENAARVQAEQALPNALPALEAKLAAASKNALAGELEKLEASLGVDPQNPAVNLGDLTKASARSRALRTLLIGLGLSILWGIVNVLGNLSGVDWFHQAGWNSVITLAAGSVASSVVSYIARVVAPPTLAKLPDGG